LLTALAVLGKLRLEPPVFAQATQSPVAVCAGKKDPPYEKKMLQSIINLFGSKQDLLARIQQLESDLEKEKLAHGLCDRKRLNAEGSRDYLTEQRGSLELQLQNCRQQLIAERQACKVAEHRATTSEKAANLLNKQIIERVAHLYRIGELIHGGAAKSVLAQKLQSWNIPVGNFSDCENQVEGAND
jgi:hypothetical protein